jgi:hypothetical protein
VEAEFAVSLEEYSSCGFAHGIYGKVRLDDKLCLLAITGTTEEGRKEP